MRIVAVMVGVDKWEELTQPAIESIKRSDPELPLVVIDNGGQPPYPFVGVRLEETMCYAAALNVGIKTCVADWYVLLNNDILLSKPILQRVAKLDPNNLYGFFLRQPGGKWGISYPFLASWCWFLSRKIWETVGEFDEEFKPLYFDDADYCIRAIKKGINLEELDRKDWGIRHLEDERRAERGVYAMKHQCDWLKNRAYLREKHGF